MLLTPDTGFRSTIENITTIGNHPINNPSANEWAVTHCPRSANANHTDTPNATKNTTMLIPAGYVPLLLTNNVSHQFPIWGLPGAVWEQYCSQDSQKKAPTARM